MGYKSHWFNELWRDYVLEIHKDGSDWRMHAPSWWIREFHTIKERGQTRLTIQKVYKLIDYEDSPEFPLDKKPYIYYW